MGGRGNLMNGKGEGHQIDTFIGGFDVKKKMFYRHLQTSLADYLLVRCETPTQEACWRHKTLIDRMPFSFDGKVHQIFSPKYIVAK